MTSSEIISTLTKASNGIFILGLVLMFIGQRNEEAPKWKQRVLMSIQCAGRLMLAISILALGIPVVLFVMFLGGIKWILPIYFLLGGAVVWWALSAFSNRTKAQREIESAKKEAESRRRITLALQEQYSRETNR